MKLVQNWNGVCIVLWILAIESSCDETGIAIMNDCKIESNIISSQINYHLKFGGIVPELASRLHLRNISSVLSLALKKANVTVDKLNWIAYTFEPGLIGSLQIGKIVAQTLSDYLEIPLIKVNHLHGHVYSGAIDNDLFFPLVSLLVSGGHTQLIYMKDHLDFEVIGTTMDDSVGECYDKVARMLNLDYPVGSEVDKLARNGNSETYKLPNVMMDKTLNFSFSGLKSACFNLIKKLSIENNFIKLADFCACFQKQCIEQLLRKTRMAILRYKPKMLVLVGGVSANYDLRKSIKLLESRDLKIIIPRLIYCTDNAAMIARVAYQKIISNKL